MGGGEAERIESVVDRVAAALFAAAVAYAFFKLANATYPQPHLGVFTASAAGIAFLLCGGVLRRVATSPSPRLVWVGKSCGDRV